MLAFLGKEQHLRRRYSHEHASFTACRTHSAPCRTDVTRMHVAASEPCSSVPTHAGFRVLRGAPLAVRRRCCSHRRPNCRSRLPDNPTGGRPELEQAPPSSWAFGSVASTRHLLIFPVEPGARFPVEHVRASETTVSN